MSRTKRMCVACILFFSLCFAGCTKAPPSYFGWREEGFTAEVRGEMNGISFCAKITVESCDGGGWQTEISYLKPEILAGTEFAVLLVDNGTPTGEVEIRMDGMETALLQDASGLAGLLLPVTCLMSPSEVAAVQKTDRGYELTLSDGSTLALGENGLPQRFASSNVTFDIVWWERAGVTGEK